MGGYDWGDREEDQLLLTKDFEVALQCRTGLSEGMLSDHRAPAIVFQLQHPRPVEPTDITIVLTPKAWAQLMIGIAKSNDEMIELGMLQPPSDDEL